MDPDQQRDPVPGPARLVAPAAGSVLAGLALAVRLLHSLAVPLPSNDGAGYLWMAERFAAGDAGAALGHAFHPGWPLLLAPGIAAGLDPFTVARLAGALCGALWVWLLWKLCRPQGTGPALVVVACAALSFDGVRLVGEAYSEPPTLCLLAASLLVLRGGRVVLAGVLLGIAYWFRPEALALLPLLWIPTTPSRRRLMAAATAVAIAAGLVLVRALACGALSPSPKLAIVLSHGPFAADGLADGLRLLVLHVARLPYEGLQGLDLVGLPFAMLGLVLLGRARRRVAALTLAALVLGWIAMVATEVKARFFLSQAPVLLPLAAFALARLGRPWLCVLFLVGPMVATVRLVHDLGDPPRSDRTAERELGRWLGTRLEPADGLVTDLPRVSYYAGREPPPPRRWTAALLRGRIEREAPSWIVLGGLREGRAALVGSLRGSDDPGGVGSPSYRLRAAVLAELETAGAIGVGRLVLLEREGPR